MSAPPLPSEPRIQADLVKWFKNDSPQWAYLRRALFMVDNGALRDPKRATQATAMGLTKGVTDLILLVPNSQYSGLLIEVKDHKQPVDKLQASWHSLMRSLRYQVIVIRSQEEGQQAISTYMQDALYPS